MSARSEQRLDELLRAGARARIARTRPRRLRERVLPLLDVAGARSRPRISRRAAWTAAAAIVVILAGLALAIANHDRPSELARSQAPNRTDSAREPQLGWRRMLAPDRGPEHALLREAELLKDDTQRLLRKLAASVRIGPGDGRS